MKFLEWLGFSNPKKLIKYELDKDSIKEHHIIRGLTNQIAELQADLAKSKVRESDKKQLTEQKQEERNIKSYLIEDKKQLDKKNKETFFSLKSFFQRYFKDEKFRNNLKIVTFDRSTDLGTFGDCGFSGNQFVLLNNKNQKVLGARDLNDLFQSVDALGKDISSLRIPINLDKDRSWIENLMVWDAPEIINLEEGKFKYSKARKRKFYELLAEKNAEIQQGYEKLEESEELVTSLQDKVDELQISMKANEKSGEIARAERVKTAKSVHGIEKIYRDTETELTQLRQISVINEDEINKLEKAFNKLKKKAEEEGITLKFDDVISKLDRIKDMFRQRTLASPQQPTQSPPNK